MTLLTLDKRMYPLNVPQADSSWRDVLRRATHPDHLVQLYEIPSAIEQTVSLFIQKGLGNDEGVIVMARKAAAEAFLSRVDQDVEALKATGQLTVLEAEAALSKFLVQGIPDWNAFRESIGGLISAVRAGGRPAVRIYADVVDVLWQQGRLSAAIRLEALWNDLAKLMPFALFCAYRISISDKPTKAEPLQDIYRVHSHLIPSPDYVHLEQAVYDSIEEVLGNEQLLMLKSLMNKGAHPVQAPNVQAMLLWMREYMPLTADKVLARSRQRYEHTAPS